MLWLQGDQGQVAVHILSTSTHVFFMCIPPPLFGYQDLINLIVRQFSYQHITMSKE